MNTGIHLIGDLQGCHFSELLGKKKRLKDLKRIISAKIEEVGLTELGNCYHYFGSYAVTAVVCLSESHISFHTWKEEKYTSLDVFVCNYKENNTKKAKELFDFLVKEIFKPEKIRKKEIKR